MRKNEEEKAVITARLRKDERLEKHGISGQEVEIVHPFVGEMDIEGRRRKVIHIRARNVGTTTILPSFLQMTVALQKELGRLGYSRSDQTSQANRATV